MAVSERTAELRSLFEDHGATVAAYFRRRARSEDAEDLVSETFVVAAEKLQQIPEGAELPWLYGVARNVLRDHYRVVARDDRLRSAMYQLPAESSDHDPTQTLSVRDAFQSLPTHMREVLLLAGWEGLSGAPLATALGVTTVAARVRLHRARSAFTQALGEQPVPNPGTTDLQRKGAR